MSGVQEDVQMGSPTASSEWPSGGGPSIRVNKNVFESLLQAVSQNRSTTVQRIRLREPDLYHGERSALAVNTWLSTVDSYYDLASLTEDEKFKYAITLLRGDALLWWNRVKQGTFAPNTWVSFRSSFIKEFCPKNTEQTARDKLAVLQQHLTVSQYISEFRTLQLQIQDMSSGDALDRFVRGLQPGLRVSVRSRFPDSLESAESMALAIESATNESCGVTSTQSTATHAQPHRVPSSVRNDDPMDLDLIRSALNAIIDSTQNRRSRPVQKGNRSQVQCFGCQGFGHYKSECPTWKKHSPSSQKGFRRQPNRNHRSLNTIFSTLSRGATVRSAPAVGDLVDLHSDTDHENLSQDRSFLSNVNNKDSDLPLYEFVLFSEFGKRNIKALLDTGASSNYISSALVHEGMKRIPLSSTCQVETAGGHVMNIRHKVEFQLAVQGLSYEIQAYVFDTKFDIILGRQWLCQAQSVPNWSTHQWLLNSPAKMETVVLTPCAGPGSTQMVDDQDLHYVISKKQLQRYSRKRLVEEVFLVSFVNQDQGTLGPVLESVEEKKALLIEFQDVFCNDLPPGLPPVRVVEHVIDTGDARPVNKPPFKMSPLELDELQKQLKELLSLGLIRPTTSPWGAPVLFVRKKDGTLRMCIDYRAVNTLTQRLNTPLPRIDECLDRLGGAKYFSSIDLKSGYHQVRIKEGDVAKTAFNTRYGSYEFLVLPFGLTNSPPTFQKMMNSVLQDYLDKFVLVYLDDILIFSRTQEEHKEHLRLILQRLRDNKLYANLKKCHFYKQEVEFLGYRISADGVLPSKAKVSAVQEWPVPTNVQEVRQFIGLCSHYRRFIPGFSAVAAPLTDLTKGIGAKKRPVQWTETCQDSFEKLKRLMTTAPVLLHPKLDQSFVIETDASDFGVGAVLLQDDGKGTLHPLAYESKKLSPTERGYPIQERELLAVLLALRSWRCFVEGSDFVVYTDHNPLQYLRSQVKPTPRLVRWMAEIEMYRPVIKYKPGKENGVPDALSRRAESAVVDKTLGLEPDYLYVTRTIADEDWPLYYHIDIPNDLADSMKQRLEREKDKFFVKDNRVWRRVKMGAKTMAVLFCPLSRRADLVARFHEGFGHVGKTTVFDLLRKRWWWSTMPQDITDWLSSCPQCQLASGANKKQHCAPMVPSSIPTAFSRWHLDFVGELPLTQKGNRWLLTAVDFSTNWPIARAVPDATAETVADFIYEEIVMKFGCPTEIVTDRGANFTSKLVKQYAQRIRTTHKLTSAFHPRTNGKCERLNGIFKAMLRKYVHGAIHMWDCFVDAALFATRVRKHRTAGFSPFYLVYGREPVLPGDILRPYLISSVANDPRTVAEHTARELEELGQARAAAEKRMLAVSEYDKQRWDAAIMKVDFEVGDHVLLRNEQKYGLEYNWMGPYLVVDKNEATNIYKLVTIGGEPYSSWVHVDRLKEVKADSINETWYNPTVSRAAWRSEMGLRSDNTPCASLDQSRSIVSEGSDVVLPKRRIKPRVPVRTRSTRIADQSSSIN